MIPVPTRRLLLLLLVPLFFLLPGFIYPVFFKLGIIIDILFAGYIVYDYLGSSAGNILKFKVNSRAVFSVGRINHFLVRVTNLGRRNLVLQLAPELPLFWEEVQPLSPSELAPGEGRDYDFRLRPTRRGKYRISCIRYRFASRGGLLSLHAVEEIDFEPEVFPDIVKLNQYLHLSRKNRLSQMGIHKNRYQGMGMELEYLREYYRDDPADRIEWKVTTRINKPVTKVYSMETGSQVTMVLDCGRLMSGEQQGLNTLDYAINAVLMLSHLVIRMGDQVSIIAFSDRIIDHLPPTKGKDALKRISHFVTPLEPELVESNYSLAFEYLRSRLQKRGILVFFSDIIDDINYGLFRKYFGYLNKRHLTLLVLLRDTILHSCAEGESLNLQEVFRAAAAQDMILKRNETISKLRLGRLNVLDLLPHQLTPRLLDKILDLKSRHMG